MLTMAFLSDFGSGEGQHMLGLRRPPHSASFSATEWRVIRLSARDGRATLRARATGPLARFGAWLFGLDRPNDYADPRLEALRRFAVAHRVHDGDAPAHYREALLSAGYSLAHADLVRDAVSGGHAVAHAGDAPLHSVILTLLALVGGLTLVARTFASYSGDAMIGGLLGALLVVIAAPLALAPAHRRL